MCWLLYKSVKDRWVQHNNNLIGERAHITVGMGNLLTHKENHMVKNRAAILDCEFGLC